MASDLDQSVSNAIAGGVSAPIDILAWLLRKSGLPGNYEKPVLGSDWMAEKGLTKPVKQSAGQVVGETVGNLVDPLGAVGSAAKGAMLLPGLLRKDLIVTTSANPLSLLTNQGTAKELYHPSFAITKDEVSPFDASWKGIGSNSVTLIPQYRAIDPRTNPVSVSAFDSYSPRHGSAQGARADELEEQFSHITSQDPTVVARQRASALRDFAENRNVDRYISRRPRGGQLAEFDYNRMPPLPGLPPYGRGGYGEYLRKEIVKEPPIGDAVLHQASYGHRFPTLEAYEKSPYGAQRLDFGQDAQDVYTRAKEFVNASSQGIQRPSNEEVLFVLRNMAARKDGKVSTRKAQNLLHDLRTTKADYGELKRFGPMQLNADNFAGALVDMSSSKSGNWRDELIKSLRNRGIPVEEFSKADYPRLPNNMSRDIFHYADLMQQAGQ